MRAARYKILLIIVLLLAVGFALFRWWQGPLMPSYILSSMSLVQNVVATGRVATVSRAEVASEISGVVLQRLVQEGDQVKPGDLLVVLNSDELLAQVRQAELALTELASSRRPQAAANWPVPKPSWSKPAEKLHVDVMQKPVSCRGKKSNRLWKQKESRAIIMRQLG